MKKYSIDELAHNIRAARQRAGYSRTELAEEIHLSKDAIAKYEQGKRIPALPELLSLATILHVELNDLLKPKKGDGRMILEGLSIVNSDAKEPIIYVGPEEIVPAWEKFYREYDAAITQDTLTDTDDDSAWDEQHSFRIFVHRDTKELVALEDFGRYQATLVDFLFRTRYVPLYTHQPESAEVLTARATRTLALFEAELLLCARFEKPLFLVEYLGTNNYRAWSLEENKFIYVYDYKEYRKAFRISEITIESLDEIKTGAGYTVCPPSKDLLDAISSYDTDLDPVIWSRKMSWDQWEPRPEKAIRPLQAKQYTDLYVDAVHLINRSRTTDCGYDKEFSLLESRVARLERADELKAPDNILDSAAGLVQKSVNTIKAALKEH